MSLSCYDPIDCAESLPGEVFRMSDESPDFLDNPPLQKCAHDVSACSERLVKSQIAPATYSSLPSLRHPEIKEAEILPPNSSGDYWKPILAHIKANSPTPTSTTSPYSLKAFSSRSTPTNDDSWLLRPPSALSRMIMIALGDTSSITNTKQEVPNYAESFYNSYDSEPKVGDVAKVSADRPISSSNEGDIVYFNSDEEFDFFVGSIAGDDEVGCSEKPQVSEDAPMASKAPSDGKEQILNENGEGDDDFFCNGGFEP